MEELIAGSPKFFQGVILGFIPGIIIVALFLIRTSSYASGKITYIQMAKKLGKG